MNATIVMNSAELPGTKRSNMGEKGVQSFHCGARPDGLTASNRPSCCR
jgi:hypothetical protein